jgi:predicted dehydrogenase
LATAARVITADKHVHLDKPAGESLPEFRQIRTGAEDQGLIVQMGYMFRYNPGFQLCYRAVEEGWLGRVFSIETVIGKVIPAAARKPLLEYEGGTMFELGCHVIDSVVYLLGKPDRVHPFKRSSSTLRDGLADNQLAVLEYPNALVTVRSALVEVEGFERRRFVVCGEQGTCDIRPLEPPRVRLALQQPRADYQTGYQEVDVPDYRRYDGDFIDLAQVIRNEKEFAWSAAHDLAVQETILRASGLPLDSVP